MPTRGGIGDGMNDTNIYSTHGVECPWKPLAEFGLPVTLLGPDFVSDTVIEVFTSLFLQMQIYIYLSLIS